jgi:undecaprenyl-diphosphatase
MLGLAFYKVVKTYLLGNDAIVLFALALGGMALIAFELWHREKDDAVQEVASITYTQAALIGLFQSLALIPGVSRSAASIVGGLALGIRRTAIVEFSFLLAVPTMLAASGLDLVKNASSFSAADTLMLVIGFAVAFVVALASIAWLLSYIRKHSFIEFGVYRILIALAFFFFILR